jgi:hypothetical protein
MIDLRSKRRLAVVAAALAVAGGGGAALAASSGRSPTPSSFFESVAKHLGISPEKLQDATKAAALDQVDAALAAGEITKSQADELKSRIEQSEWPVLGGFGLLGGFPGWQHGMIGGKLEAAADYLGLTSDELAQRLSDGRSLADVASAEGKSVDGLKEAILEDARTRVDEAVKAGRLTEEQAAAILDGLEERIDDIVNRSPRAPLDKGGLRFRVGPPPAGGPFWDMPA